MRKQEVILKVLEYLREHHSGDSKLREVHDAEIEHYRKVENGESEEKLKKE